MAKYTVRTQVIDHEDRNVVCASHEMEGDVETKGDLIQMAHDIYLDWFQEAVDFDCNPEDHS